jgi:lantibiotic biosynthesis protein
MDHHGEKPVKVYRGMGPVVYGGTAGIGLYLARLAQIIQDPIIRTTALGALAQALAAVNRLHDEGEYGFYSGLAGIAWCCIECGILLEREDLAARGRAVVLRAASLTPDPLRLDIINGSAGLIHALLDIARDGELKQREQLLEAAVRHGEHLLALATRTAQGWSWDTLGAPNEPHLLGFAHGCSGIASALMRLGVATERQDFFAAAQAGLTHERSLFRPIEGNWPDLRSFVQPGPGGEPPCMLAWCHGAPGIGFARLALHRLLPNDGPIKEEADIAINSTTISLTQPASGVGNSSLCHGDCGNADLLVLAADLLGRLALRDQAEAAGERMLERIEDLGMPWPCGTPSAVETPDLMLGLAGIGYFFLRLHDSVGIPTVLLPGARTQA